MTRFLPRRALLSVSDKTGLADLAKVLRNLDCELITTGGTGQYLQEHEIQFTDLSKVTEFPEILDGRVKTLHPMIYGGILSRRQQDEDTVAAHGIGEIDIVIVNLYPFELTVASSDHTYAEAIESIDIGGPCLVRAAAKNHHHVLVVVDPSDYPKVSDSLTKKTLDFNFRQRLSAKAFQQVAAYDIAIANYFSRHDELPSKLLISAGLQQRLRYGENPHQQAGYYASPAVTHGGIAAGQLRHGKELSYNNIADADAALQCVSSFPPATCVIVKHNSPCGVAQRSTPQEAYHAAVNCDPVSAFGGVIAFNQEIDVGTVTAILKKQFVEVIIAPKIQSEVISVLKDRPSIRLIEVELNQKSSERMVVEQVSGGFLYQESDNESVDYDSFRCVTDRQPNEREKIDLEFAWRTVRFVKSNAIVVASDQRTIGIGAGQMSRVMSVRIALWKAQEEGLDVNGSVLASDAFFPFPDSIELACLAGVKAVIQPGGSVRDDEVIKAANERQVSMIMTGQRHFRH